MSAAREPTLKVAAVAKRLGVAPATLRTWARRYGLGPPAHTAGAHRQYTPEDLTRLLEMRRLTLEGVAPGEAARIALELDVDPAAAAAAAGITGLPVARAVPALEDVVAGALRDRGLHDRSAGDRAADDRAADDRGADDRAADDRAVEPTRPAPWPAARGRGTGPFAPAGRAGFDGAEPAAGLHERAARRRTNAAVPLPEPVRLLVESARALDGGAMRRRLRALLTEAGVVRTWEDVAVPALAAVGDAWADTGRGVDVEHALSQALLQVLNAVVVSAEEPVFGDVLLACVEEEQHSLPLTALAAALAERRVDADVLGGRVPASSLLDAVRTRRPKIVLLYAACQVRPAQLAVLDEVEERTRLLLGGSAWAGLQLPDGAVRAPSLSTAVDQIRLAVRH